MSTIIKNQITHQSSVIYGMGFIGALVYFLMHATSFWTGVVGVIKAIFWPAVAIYKLFDYWNV